MSSYKQVRIHFGTCIQWHAAVSRQVLQAVTQLWCPPPSWFCSVVGEGEAGAQRPVSCCEHRRCQFVKCHSSHQWPVLSLTPRFQEKVFRWYLWPSMCQSQSPQEEGPIATSAAWLCTAQMGYQNDHHTSLSSPQAFLAWSQKQKLHLLPRSCSVQGHMLWRMWKVSVPVP